jgi:hypothetical protein
MKTCFLFSLVVFAVQVHAQDILGNVRYVPNPNEVSIPEPTFRPVGPRAQTATGSFLNTSFRCLIGESNPSIVTGFVISEGDRVILIRAVGPTLASFGFSGALARPQLEIFDSNARSVAAAVPWGSTRPDTQAELKQAAADVGAFPLRDGSDDQVLLVFLRRGAYTCVVSGIQGSAGAVMLEIYAIPSYQKVLPPPVTFPPQ